LAEIKTIGKRLEKKRAAIGSNLARDSRLKDPLTDSVEYVRSERQAVADLEARVVSIRTAIQKSNLDTKATINDKTMSVAEWLTFRREVAPGRQAFLNQINMGIKQMREKVIREGGRVTSGVASATAIVEANKPTVEVIIHLDEKSLLEEQEAMEKTLGDLDGKLSLLNATTVIEF
jgi:L-lactate utilization protein LutB